ncbi:MAG: DUF2846 domain-containing protein [Oleispira sp.]
MIRIGLLLLSVLMLPSCTIYQSIGHNFGSFVSAPNGQDFQPVGYRWDYEHTALVYVYRPASTWANDELEAPSFYLNDERLFNIKGNGYTWYELKPGNHEVKIRRPLMGLEGIDVTDVVDFTLKMVTELSLNAKAGHVYYLRYSEVDKDAAKFSDMTFLDNPLQVVTPDVALAEIQQTNMLGEGRGLIAAIPVVEKKKVTLASATVSAEKSSTDNDSTAVEKVETKAEENKSWSPF